eukprot:10317410-Alexandrium_andersonii.AAC.1
MSEAPSGSGHAGLRLVEVQLPAVRAARVRVRCLHVALLLSPEAQRGVRRRLHQDAPEAQEVQARQQAELGEGGDHPEVQPSEAGS